MTSYINKAKNAFQNPSENNQSPLFQELFIRQMMFDRRIVSFRRESSELWPISYRILYFAHTPCQS